MPTNKRRGKTVMMVNGKPYNFEFAESSTNFAVIASFVLLTVVMLANIQLSGLYQGLLLLAVIILFIGLALRLTGKQ